MQGNPRAVVADDSHFMRSVITDILSAGGIEVVGEAHNGCKAVERIKKTAVENEVHSPEELETMDDSRIYDLVFHPGFSTAEEVTDTSGRGVGMDVVHDTVTQMDGSVDVDSTPGQGTTVSLRLPVTMAIVKVLLVQVGEEEYGIPIKNVDEEAEQFAVRKAVKEKVSFEQHDLIRGDPKRDFDLVLCRNLLIYIDASYKTPIFRTIRGSLRDGGYLMIGMTETLPTECRDEFEPAYKQHRIYRRT